MFSSLFNGFSLNPKPDTVVQMNTIWRGVKGELVQMALRILAMIANSGGNERAFSVLGRTYSDKTRNLLNPEHDDEDPANGNITELAHCLNELPEDGDAGDDNSPEPEIVQAILRPSIRLHFGTEELYDLDKIFAEASINTVSTWGGSLLSYQWMDLCRVPNASGK
ncbi:hypothetical protein B0H10DRAFT_2202962 [Mycena sp. CBHHK59/15]|nr:hypothetical protein B0H10DRAFT_2202962 [Mycena sp. CBHHK59/15]